MGFGGALIWTGLTRNLKQRWPDKKVVLVQPRSLKQIVRRKPYSNNIVYEHNPDIDVVTDKVSWLWQRWRYPKTETIVVDMTKPAYQYWTKQTGDRVIYRQGKHAIQYACDVHGITEADLHPRLVLTNDEEQRVDTLLAQHNLEPKRFIVLEPHTKTSYTPNKAWPWDRWQALAERLEARGVTMVQVGVAGKDVLPGAHDLTGTTSFRETGRILEQAKLFVGCVGGLLHLSRAMGTSNVVIASPWEPAELATYPGDENIFATATDHACGKLTRCATCQQLMDGISVDRVYQAIVDQL